jgi:hypothetical protein
MTLERAPSKEPGGVVSQPLQHLGKQVELQIGGVFQRAFASAIGTNACLNHTFRNKTLECKQGAYM